MPKSTKLRSQRFGYVNSESEARRVVQLFKNGLITAHEARRACGVIDPEPTEDEMLRTRVAELRKHALREPRPKREPRRQL